MKNKKGAVEIHWGQPHISAVPGREERWPSGTPLHVSAAPAASCREGKPQIHFVKTSRHPLREPCKRARDGNKTEMREPHAHKGMQDESRKPVPATFCRQPRNAVRQEPAPRVSPAMGMAGKRTNGVCTRTDSIQNGKSLPKPCFSLPSAPAGTVLRQKSFVFAEGSSFLCGKRFCFYREKTTAGPEKCSIQTVPPSAF